MDEVQIKKTRDTGQLSKTWSSDGKNALKNTMGITSWNTNGKLDKNSKSMLTLKLVTVLWL